MSIKSLCCHLPSCVELCGHLTVSLIRQVKFMSIKSLCCHLLGCVELCGHLTVNLICQVKSNHYVVICLVVLGFVVVVLTVSLIHSCQVIVLSFVVTCTCMYSMVTTGSTSNDMLGIILVVHNVYFILAFPACIVLLMGRPSPERKKAKRKNQKVKRKLFHKAVVTADSCTSGMSLEKSNCNMHWRCLH